MSDGVIPMGKPRSVFADLTESLFSGIFEVPLWRTFLDKLRIVSGARLAHFYCHPPGGKFGRGIYLFSGEIVTGEDHETFNRRLWPLGTPSREYFCDNKSHDFFDAARIAYPPTSKLWKELERNSVSDLKLLNITEPSGVEASLFLSKGSGNFEHSVDLLLEDLAPTIQGVLQIYLRWEMERYQAAIGMEAVSRSGIGWMTLDNRGRVLEHDKSCAALLKETTVISIDQGGRLRILSQDIEREIHCTISRIVEGKGSRVFTSTISKMPWIELMVEPTRRTPVSTSTPAVAIIYIRHDIEDMDKESNNIRKRFGLSYREAQLVIALIQGCAVAEAAGNLGITINTARSYLRSIYSKTSASGLLDLVRIVGRTNFYIDGN